MLEILIVLVIIAIAATLVAPGIDSGMRQRNVRSAVRAVAGSMRALQADAVRTGVVQRMVVDQMENLVRLRNGAVDMADSVQIAEVRGGELLPGGMVAVNFYPNGSNTGVDVLLGERGAPAIDGFIVHLDPLIGLVTVVDPRRR